MELIQRKDPKFPKKYILVPKDVLCKELEIHNIQGFYLIAYW